MKTTDHTIEVAFAAMRISKSATLMLEGRLQDVFPLFTPIREKEWAEGWEPEIVYGSDIIKEGMIFKTRSSFDHGEHFQWIVSKYDEQNSLVEYTVTAPNRVWFIEVHCKSHQDKTLSTVTYIYTGLTADGHQQNKIALNKIFANNLTDWEDAINHYLRTGKKL